MIFDTFANASRYFAPGTPFRQAVDYAASFDPRRPDGISPVAGDRLVAIVKRYTTFAPEAKRFETHRRYADVQVLLEGEEAVHVALCPENEAAMLEPYNEADDKIRLHPPSDWSPLRLCPGRFLVLFPGDVHRADCHWRTPTAVRKLCLKVRL